MKKAIAVVILNYNGKHFLAQFLPLVVTHSPEADIYVVDNASTDESVIWLRRGFPHIRLICFKTNLGFCEGYNQALQQIQFSAYQYFVLLNSDVEVTPHWLQALHRLLEQHPNVAACQPKIKSYTQRTHFEYAGAAGGFIDKLGYPFCRGRIFSTTEPDIGQYNEPCPIFWATGACLFIRSEVYAQLNGLDSSFFAHMEEIDLCWRIQRMGMEVWYQPASEVFHVGGGTLAQTNPFKTFLNFRNNLLLLYKNLPPKKFKKLFLQRLFLDLLAACMWATQGKYKNAWAILKAYYAFWQQRVKVQKTELPYPKHLKIHPKSIVWQYFIKKRRTFAELYT